MTIYTNEQLMEQHDLLTPPQRRLVFYKILKKNKSQRFADEIAMLMGKGGKLEEKEAYMCSLGHGVLISYADMVELNCSPALAHAEVLCDIAYDPYSPHRTADLMIGLYARYPDVKPADLKSYKNLHASKTKEFYRTMILCGFEVRSAWDKDSKMPLKVWRYRKGYGENMYSNQVRAELARLQVKDEIARVDALIKSNTSYIEVPEDFI